MRKTKKTSPNKETPVHKWTHTGNKVLLLRCGTVGHNNFQWPKSGKTICPEAEKNRELAQIPSCDSGGLFGWPWGLGIGKGKTLDYQTDWIVFSANPEDVIWVNGKAKAVGEVEIVHCGPWYECQKILEDGRRAWIVQNSDSASTSGNYSSASTSRYQSSASTNGISSSASTSGISSSASTSGNSSSASTSGISSSASTSGDQSSASTGGFQSSASTSGFQSSAFTREYFSSASASGYQSSASASGFQSSASTSGDRSSASTIGKNSIASCCGDGCSVVALGNRSIAAVVGKTPTVEVGESCVGVVYASDFYWKVKKNSRVIQLFETKEYILKSNVKIQGKTVRVVNGKIINIKK